MQQQFLSANKLNVNKSTHFVEISFQVSLLLFEASSKYVGRSLMLSDPKSASIQ
jgi:hypothetical protein